MPLVSIVTPAYNCINTIKKTYDSVLSQTFKDWEWIIVEDHSKDNSFDFIKEMTRNDKRVILLRTEKNSGAAVARNVGIEKASGKFVAFLDADDLWYPEKLEKQIEFMKNNDYLLTYTDYDLLLANGKTKQYVTKKSSFTYKSLLKTNGIGCLTAMYDASKLGKVYMPLDCEKREDHGIWLDMTRNGLIAYKLSAILSTYRVGNGTVSSSKFKMVKYQYLLYRKHEKFNIIKSAWYVFLCSFNKVFRKY